MLRIVLVIGVICFVLSPHAQDRVDSSDRVWTPETIVAYLRSSEATAGEPIRVAADVFGGIDAENLTVRQKSTGKPVMWSSDWSEALLKVVHFSQPGSPLFDVAVASWNVEVLRFDFLDRPFLGALYYRVLFDFDRMVKMRGLSNESKAKIHYLRGQLLLALHGARDVPVEIFSYLIGRVTDPAESLELRSSSLMVLASPRVSWNYSEVDAARVSRAIADLEERVELSSSERVQKMFRLAWAEHDAKHGSMRHRSCAELLAQIL